MSNPKASHCYPYPRPALTVDTVIVAGRIDSPAESKILLIKRLNPPFKDSWALPGGFVDENEGLDAAARRELLEETSVDSKSITFTQVGAFGDPGRDPRGWTVTVAYAALVPSTDLGVKAADDARDACWFPLHELLPQTSGVSSSSAAPSSPALTESPSVSLAFDHSRVVAKSLAALANAEAAAHRDADGGARREEGSRALEDYLRSVALQMEKTVAPVRTDA